MRFGVVAAMFAVAASGCAVPLQDGSGTIHYVIVGVGIVSVPSPDQSHSSAAVAYHSLGILATDQPTPKLTLGYASGSLLSVPTTAQALISVDQLPFGRITFTQTPYGEH